MTGVLGGQCSLDGEGWGAWRLQVESQERMLPDLREAEGYPGLEAGV